MKSSLKNFLSSLKKVIFIEEESASLLLLRRKFHYFQKLLQDNNYALETMADMEEKLTGEYIFDRHYINSKCMYLTKCIYSIAESINEISGNKYLYLYEVSKKINSEIEEIISRKVEIPVTDYTIPLDNINKDMILSVGGKNANLGEVKNRLDLPVPEGFAISAYAFKRFVNFNNISDNINQKLSSLNLDNMEKISSISKDIQNSIKNAEIPPDLEKSILDSYSDLCGKTTSNLSVSLRSSAPQEDGEFSFAGQYATVLGVSGKDLVIEKYKEVVASLFTPRAIFYYKSNGFREEDMAMSVGVLAMVNSKSSGIMYSRDPNDYKKDIIIINAVRGLGSYAVDGAVKPNIYLVSRKADVILEKDESRQKVMLILNPDGGVEERKVSKEIISQSCLSNKQILNLAKYAIKLEEHYKKPQDIEWAIDQDDHLYILQTRPLRVIDRETVVKPIPTRVKGYNILIDRGAVACKGIAYGNAFLVRNDEDLKQFPDGAVLISKTTSTKFVTVMNKASAIITDIGSITGHMASLSREFQIPAILNTGIATKTIKDGQEITIDAINCNIYDGRVNEIIELGSKKVEPFKDTMLFRTLGKVLKKIVPLNLTDPESEEFNPESCKTFHDITRFAHEKAIDEMFVNTESPDLKKGDKVELILNIPHKIYVIDLEDGIEKVSKKITLDNIRSIPMKAFLKGILSVKWPGPRPVDSKGSAFAGIHTDTGPERSMSQLSDKSHALISRKYMNFSIRLGYHLSTVEAYIGENLNDNYIQFFFQGGGASLDRRLRRTILIKDILEKLDFKVRKAGDVVEAKIAKFGEDYILKKLDILGRLTVYTKQLDMVMFNDSMVEWFKDEFLKEHLKELS